jgi:4-hydroxybenzoate polyprenyltransferase
MNHLNNYLKLIRFYSPTGTILLFLPILYTYLFFSTLPHNLTKILLFALEAFLMRSAGCIINDLFDIKYDQKVARSKLRPLASNMIAKLDAIVFLILILFLALLIGLSFKWETIIWASFLIVPITIYPLTKRFFALPQLFLGLTFNSSIFIIALELNFAFNLQLFLLYIATVFWTIGYDTIYAHQDKLDDQKIGIKSSAITFGIYNKEIISICYILFFLFIITIAIIQGFNILFLALFTVTAIVTIFIIKEIDLDNNKQCAQFFIKNNILGTVIALQILSGRII